MTELSRGQLVAGAAATATATVAAMPAPAIAAVEQASVSLIEMFPAKDWTFLSQDELLALLDEPLWGCARLAPGSDGYNLEDLNDDEKGIW